MALPVPHPLSESQLTAHSASVGATPQAAYVYVPWRSQLLGFNCTLHGTLTGDATVTVAVNGTSAGTFTLTASGSAAASTFTGAPTAATYLNEGDVLSFTSASGTGSTIRGTYGALIRRG